jgi:pyruvate/2-oxoglutarate dehydrogenase complex dihydrolipoamide acyltransferase (E2) component
VLKVLVIQGQAVRQGEALAVVRAADTVQYGAALARSQAELPVAAAQAARLGQLAREGIIAPPAPMKPAQPCWQRRPPWPKTAACWRWAARGAMARSPCARRSRGASPRFRWIRARRWAMARRPSWWKMPRAQA